MLWEQAGWAGLDGVAWYRIAFELSDAQAKHDQVEVEGVAGGGLVSITATAKGRIRRVQIDESLLQPSEKQMLEDLLRELNLAE